eukprot:1013764-Heterocapsa_arctica.AAC.1
MEKAVKMLNGLFNIKWVDNVSAERWTKFLGREWRRCDAGFRVRIPPTYFQKVLKEFNMEKCKPVNTPFVPGVRHREDEERSLEDMKHQQYRRA